VYAAVIRTASKQLQLRLELGNLSVNVYMLVQVCTSRTVFSLHLLDRTLFSQHSGTCWQQQPAGTAGTDAYGNGFLLVQTVQNRASCSETPETNAV
jgi:hypothetical protein